MSNANLYDSIFEINSCTFYKRKRVFKCDWYSVIRFLEEGLNRGYVSYLPIEIKSLSRKCMVNHRYVLTDKAKALLVMEKL